MFQHIVYSLENRHVRTCKTRLDRTTKFMVVVTSLFNLVISSFPDNMFYHAWSWLLIYHDGLNMPVMMTAWTWPAWIVLLTGLFMHVGTDCSWLDEQTDLNNVVGKQRASSTMFKPVNRQKQAVCFYVCTPRQPSHGCFTWFCYFSSF